VRRKIERAAQLGFSSVVLSGGEATIRPELLPWARQAARLDLGLGLVTNGRMLAYPKLVDSLVADGLQYVHLSLHAADPEIHNRLVRAEAHEQTVRALSVLVGRGLEVTVACVVTRQNLSVLRNLVELLSPFEGFCLKFSMAEPKGGGDALFDQLVPTVSEAAAAVNDAIDHGTSRYPGARYAHESFPLCLLPGKETLQGDLRASGFSHMSEAYEDDFLPIDFRNRTHPGACRDCALQGPCPGLFRGYHDRRGENELQPVTAPRSNSFNYLVASRAVAWPAETPCPLLESPPAVFDRNRLVFLRMDGEMRPCETRSRDFSDREIEEIKFGTGQLYFDVSQKPAIDDFPADLRRLVPVEECGACPERGRCPGCYRVADRDVFAPDRGRLADLLKTLRGSVLDVGCGEGRHLPVFAPLVEAGQVSYLGVEPDRAAARVASERYPWAELSVASIEEVLLEAGAWDNILLLNSYNHLRLPGEVMPKLTDALLVGGTLIVADDVAFALVRNEEQARRAEQGPARFEHYRNHGARQALELLSGLPLELLEKREVDSATGNQWLLRFRRREGG
jgi:MoaA/NifB/PqqE/SkfB family radical SAM enzyme